MINVQPFFLGFKNSKIEKPYEKADFINKVVIPSEADIMEKTIDFLNKEGSPADKSNVIYSVGKIFENNGRHDVARDFFEKNMQILVSDNRSKMEINDANLDINRINEKILIPNKFDVQV